MKIEQGSWSPENGFSNTTPLENAQWVLYFSSFQNLKEDTFFPALKARFPHAHITGATSGGEIAGNTTQDDSYVYVATHFDHVRVKTTICPITHNHLNPLELTQGSYECGVTLAKDLAQDKDLRAIFLLSDGIPVNGSALLKGINSVIDPAHVTVTGGFACDGGPYVETRVGCNAPVASHQIVAVGLYGDALEVKVGCEGGWSEFGPIRQITKAHDNALLELDGKPALDIYKQYLGDDAKNLPASALKYPLGIWDQNKEGARYIIRTIHQIVEGDHTIHFSGDVPQGWKARLMWGRFDAIVEGAAKASKQAEPTDLTGPSLSILVSCLGRKVLMGQRVAEEISASAEVLGNDNTRIGFYSLGEIAPHELSKESAFHNQTMTITTFYEKV
ncbi:MAG: FIST C-terminal domain-containing protein [Proteobacteria bacterium]|nr:FIST C-terminal domain-containing protein [Pseudomonadota bacterium]